MKKIETHINIHASTATVWKALMNFPEYATWNPFIQIISGKPSINETLQVRITPPESKAMIFTPIVLEATENTAFRWLGKLGIKGLFDGEHYFKLVEISSEETQFIHGERFTGVFVNPLLWLIGDNTIKGFHQMNHALKNHLEK
jgi:hypothetical protein